MTTTERLYDAIQKYLEERPNATHCGILGDILQDIEQEVVDEKRRFQDWLAFQGQVE